MFDCPNDISRASPRRYNDSMVIFSNDINDIIYSCLLLSMNLRTLNIEIHSIDLTETDEVRIQQNTIITMLIKFY